MRRFIIKTDGPQYDDILLKILLNAGKSLLT
jgi:hypothetical protein